MDLVFGNVDSEFDPRKRSRSHSKKKKAQHIFGRSDTDEKIPPRSIQSRSYVTNKRKQKLMEQYDVARAESPTQSAALAAFHEHNPSIPPNTMKAWLRRRDSIQATVAAGRSEASATRSLQWLQRQQTGRFDKQENALFAEILDLRLKGEQVSVQWVQARMLELVKASEAQDGAAFKASGGWCQKFFDRFELVMRKATNVKALTVEQRLPAVRNFYRYVQKVCTEGVHVCDVYGVYPLETRIHVDEVPCELGGVLDRTVAVRGEKRVQVVHPKVRVETRQCSLMLAFFADGRIGPCGVCMERTPTPLGKQDPLLESKHELVDPRVPHMPAAREEFNGLRAKFPDIFLYCQPKGYFDVRTFAAYWDDMVSELPDVPHVVIMDNAEGHFSSHVRQASRVRNIQLVSTPANCTDLCAATDAGLGRSLKLLIKKRFLQHFRANLDSWRTGKVLVRERRELHMKWLSEAVAEFGVTGKQQIINAHVRCGTGLRFNI